MDWDLFRLLLSQVTYFRMSFHKDIILLLIHFLEFCNLKLVIMITQEYHVVDRNNSLFEKSRGTRHE